VGERTNRRARGDHRPSNTVEVERRNEGRRERESMEGERSDPLSDQDKSETSTERGVMKRKGGER